MKPRPTPELPLADVTPNLKLEFRPETVVEFTNMHERLGKFYYWHVADGECPQPNLRLLNPEYRGERIHTRDDVWLFRFYKGYRVLILKHHRSSMGPHAARLYYQSQTTRYLYWLATLQIDGIMFYNEEAILTELKRCIVNQEFFMSEQSAKLVCAL